MDVKTNSNQSLVVWPKVFLYGDSHTQWGYRDVSGWVSTLSDALVRKCDVINRGFGGYNSRWNSIMMPRIFSADIVEGAVAIVLFIGTNDSNDGDINPRHHVPVDEYKSNLIKMVEYLQSIGVSKEIIIIVSPPPCDDDKWTVCAMENHNFVSGKKDELTKNYVKASEEAALESGVDFVDIYNPMKEQKDWTAFFYDGMHFSKEGTKFMFELLWPHLERLTEHLPELMPLWREVDYTQPERTLLS